MEKLVNALPVADRMTGDFTFGFESSKSVEKIFESLLDTRVWWSGLYSEKIEGTSNKLSDEFTFKAGDGAHYSKQRLTELIPNKKIVWLVVESNLTFLKNSGEWTGTRLCFDIFGKGNKSQIRFTHFGLVPAIESYDGCARAWTKYLENFAKKLS
jgi:hypothetical protein